jgi:hypothetical protein
MNTQLLETTSTTREHERSSESHQQRKQTRLDRLAMRLGLALLVWSRRTVRRLDAEQVSLQHRLTAQVRQEQESTDRTRSLLGPR